MLTRFLTYMAVALLAVLSAYVGTNTYHRIRNRRVAVRPSPGSRLQFPTFPPSPAPSVAPSDTPGISGISPVITKTLVITAIPLSKTITPTRAPSASATPPASASTSIPSTATPVPEPSPASIALKWGAYVSWEPGEVLAFENLVGRKASHIATFVHWGNENSLPLDLGNLAKADGQNLILFWEAMDYNVNSPTDARFSYDAILGGNWDYYLKSFAEQAKDFGGPIVLVPFEEANGDWYPWSLNQNGNSIDKHIAAYRYVRKFFDGIGNVKFAWTVNCESSEGIEKDIKKYYPGDDYVDLVGVNGFNFGDPWMTFSQIFDNTLTQLETIGKPIMIFSTASAPGSGKAAWITDFGQQINKHPQIVGWNWFNENKEKDWRVNSDSDSLNAFKSILP